MRVIGTLALLSDDLYLRLVHNPATIASIINMSGGSMGARSCNQHLHLVDVAHLSGARASVQTSSNLPHF